MGDLISKYGAQIITGAFVLSGVLFGLFWNQFFNWVRYKREKKSKLNHLLFQLLELYHFANRYNFSDFIKLYLVRIEKRLGVLSEEDKKQVQDIITQVINQKLDMLKNGEESKKLSDHYENAVKEISSINPFLAFRLAGQSNHLSSLRSMSEYFDSVRHLVPTIQGQDLLKDFERQYSDERLIREVIDDIKESIVNVSVEIGMHTKRKSTQHIHRQEMNIKDGFDKEINTIISQIENYINQNS